MYLPEVVRSLAAEYAEKFNALTAEIKETEKDPLLSMEGKNVKLADLRSRRNALQESTEEAVDKAVEEYKGIVKDHFKLRAEDITEDAKLLNCGLTLNLDDVDELIEKYKDKNPTMMRMIIDYMEKNMEGNILIHYNDESVMNAAAESVREYGKYILNNPVHAAEFTTDECLAKTFPDKKLFVSGDEKE